MGETKQHPRVLLVMAVISRHPEAIQWARELAKQQWGDIALMSPEFEFTETRFYETSMGDELRKQFLAFESLMDPGTLAAIKQQTNAWETRYQSLQRHDETRPLNLDPGYISEAKLVLATTKDRDHRVYLGDGIYAEVTLHFQKAAWQSRAWTYPDYQREDYHRFFTQCRDYLRSRHTHTTS